MERTQISLTQEQADRLRHIAARRGTSMAALIREAVDRVHPTADDDLDARYRRALQAAHQARPSGVSDASVEHDRYLDDAYVAKVPR